MPFLLTLLVVMLFSVVTYTGVVMSRHGGDFISLFFGEIVRMTWVGQFNLDFLCMLLLSALWVAWRHRFSAAGIGLAGLALLGGTPFLCIYLLVESARSGGDVGALLLGSRQHHR